MGLDTVTHFYGHFESLLKDGRLPKYPSAYNMFNEQDRFYEIANLAAPVVEPGSPEWQAYLEAQLENGGVFNPTLNIYSRSEEHTSELQSLMRISYAVFRLKKIK